MEISLRRNRNFKVEISLEALAFPTAVLIAFVFMVLSSFQSKAQMSTLIAIENEQNLRQQDQADKNNAFNLAISSKYTFKSGQALSAAAAIAKDLKYSENTELKNIPIKFTFNKNNIGKSDFKIFSHMGTVLPANKEEYRINRLQTAFTAGATIENNNFLSKERLKSWFRLQLTKNIHEYDLNINSEPLIEYALSTKIYGELTLSQLVSLSSDVELLNAKTYRGFERSTFVTNADINFNFTKEATVNVGVSNGGNLLKNDGVNSNFNYFSENTSTVRFGLSLQI